MLHRSFPVFLLLFVFLFGQAQETDGNKDKGKKKAKTLYGTASYYANKFEGRKTASGEPFRQEKMTGASNKVPLGTWVKVINQRNGRSVTVRVNDRMHPKMNRVIDLSRAAARQLGYLGAGLTRVKVIVLGKKKPED